MSGRRVRLALVAALCASAAGCAADPTAGYSTAPAFRADVTSVAVPIFANDTHVRELEFELTDALVKEIQTRTPYAVLPSARADTVLLGRIRRVEFDSLSKSRLTGLSEEVVLSVTIDFEWRDLRTDALLVARHAFEAGGLFVPSRPTAEPIEIGRFAVVQQLARDVVSQMHSGW
jgi:hypothetical protein